MDIKKVIQDLESGTISTKATAEAFLNSYTPQEQKQIIAAMYIGRDYFHENQFKEGHLPSSSEVDHIPQTDYAEILRSKGKENVAKYLGIFDKCAENSKFDMKNF